MKRILFCLLLIPLCAYAQELEIISLKHRSVEDVLPIIQPMLDKDGVASGMNYQLILRTSAHNLAQIKQILESIDTAPRRLNITVLQNVDEQTLIRIRQLSGRIVLGESADINLALQNNNQQQVDHKTQQIQVLEGHRALIQSGQYIPRQQRQVISNRWGKQVVEQIYYQPINSGFYVQPKVNGPQVTIEIYTQNDQNQRIQQANSTITGRIGEWLVLADEQQQQQKEQKNLLGSNSSEQSHFRNILIKVEELK